MLAGVTVNPDVSLPWAGFSRIHLQAEFTSQAASLDFGRLDGIAIDLALGLAVKLIFVGKAAVPVPGFVGRGKPQSCPDDAAGDVIEFVAVVSCMEVHAVIVGVEVFAIDVKAPALVHFKDFADTDMGSIVSGVLVVAIPPACPIVQDAVCIVAQASEADAGFGVPVRWVCPDCLYNGWISGFSCYFRRLFLGI